MRGTGLAGGTARALLEVLAVGGLYILVTRLAVSGLWQRVDWYDGLLGPLEARIATGFTLGALVQLVLLALMLIVMGDGPLRRGLATLRLPAARPGWVIAISVAVIDVAVLYAVWIGPVPVDRQLSGFGIAMSLAPAVDGLTQEAVFRGYVLLRLADTRLGAGAQARVSGALFGAMHFGYGQALEVTGFAGLWALAVPALGTFGLGVAWAFAFLAAGRRLLPVVVSHALVIAAVQPWLALAYAGG